MSVLQDEGFSVKLRSMGKGAPLRWVENRYLRGYLRGAGMEIGALWRRFPVHPQARVVYVDRASVDDLKTQHSDVTEQIVQPDLIADAAELPVAPGSLDFVVANHVLEHLPFPLAALKCWHQALAPGGALLVKVPDKRYTFDSRRARTPLARLVFEYEHPELFDWRAHYVDWVENVDCRQPTDIELARALPGLMSGAFNIHYQVWIDDDILEIVDFTRRVWGFDWEPKVFLRAHFYRKEAVVILGRPR